MVEPRGPDDAHAPDAAKVTGSPELAVADTVNDEPTGRGTVRMANAITWLPEIAEVDRLTGVAGFQRVLPAWKAVTRHSATDTNDSRLEVTRHPPDAE